MQPLPSHSNCPLTCHHGNCVKYVNEDTFFRRCDSGWSGVRCDIPVRCSDCSNDSICIGMISNRSICSCPLYKSGSCCLLTFSCEKNNCNNNGQCVMFEDGVDAADSACFCSERFSGHHCNTQMHRLEISLNNIKHSSFSLMYLLSHYGSVNLIEDLHPIKSRVILQKLALFQRTISLNSSDYVDMVFVKLDTTYYLAVHQPLYAVNISTSIDSNQTCSSINELLNSQFLNMPEIQRIKRCHRICQTHLRLMCFYDSNTSDMCLCTREHHANCFKFQSISPPKCWQNSLCQNEGECLQDASTCPATTMCNCTNCFFGDQCQFYAKGECLP